jgi:hypothetical protein
MLLRENKTIADAVSNVTPDWSFPPGSEMRYYPSTDAVGSLRVSDLIAEAEGSMTSEIQLTILNYSPNFMLNKINCKLKNFRRVMD